VPLDFLPAGLAKERLAVIPVFNQLRTLAGIAAAASRSKI
jgi:hypothetical protein